MRRAPRVALIGALFLGAVLVFHEPIRGGTLSFLRFPFTVAKACVSLLLTLPRLPSLTRENASLRSELMQRQLENAQLREMARHAQQAQALIETRPSPQGILAVVIGRSTIPTQQMVSLDKGGRHGLTLDSAVVDASGVIGRVVELHPTTCLVMLLTDPESRVAGLVERSRETGLLVGRAGGQGEFIYLDVHADIGEGDRIVTAGLGGPFPKGLLLGKVVRVFRDEQSGAAWARVEPAARLGQLEEVLCLPPQTSATIAD
jgi:rod shape-determining protein MreC